MEGPEDHRGIPVTEGMTMMDAIVKILKERNVSQTGAENGYISEIGGLKEFDNGQDSGWMGTLNGWFTNKGFQNYVIKPGDEIRIMYTSTGRGADLGGDWGSSDKRLKALDISDSDYLTMFPGLLAGRPRVCDPAPCGSGWYRGAQSSRRAHGHEQAVSGACLCRRRGDPPPRYALHCERMDIQITCGDPSWETACDNTPAAQTYTVHIVRPGTLLNAESVSVKTIKGDPSLKGAPSA